MKHVVEWFKEQLTVFLFLVKRTPWIYHSFSVCFGPKPFPMYSKLIPFHFLIDPKYFYSSKPSILEFGKWNRTIFYNVTMNSSLSHSIEIKIEQTWCGHSVRSTILWAQSIVLDLCADVMTGQLKTKHSLFEHWTRHKLGIKWSNSMDWREIKQKQHIEWNQFSHTTSFQEKKIQIITNVQNISSYTKYRM